MNLASGAGLREAGFTKPFKTEIGLGGASWEGTVIRNTFRKYGKEIMNGLKKVVLLVGRAKRWSLSLC